MTDIDFKKLHVCIANLRQNPPKDPLAQLQAEALSWQLQAEALSCEVQTAIADAEVEDLLHGRAARGGNSV